MFFDDRKNIIHKAKPFWEETCKENRIRAITRRTCTYVFWKCRTSYAVLPYINGSTEPLKRLLKRYGIRTTTKPLRTLEQGFPSPKDRPLPEKQTNVVYKINCADCSWSYIGETGRALETRKKEHKRNVKQSKSGSNIAKHAWTQDHKINFDECEILDKATYRHRATLESWHTATTVNSDNNAQHLPEQYRFLLKKNRS
jgi:hypothetical protein